MRMNVHLFFCETNRLFVLELLLRKEKFTSPDVACHGTYYLMKSGGIAVWSSSSVRVLSACMKSFAVAMTVDFS